MGIGLSARPQAEQDYDVLVIRYRLCARRPERDGSAAPRRVMAVGPASFRDRVGRFLAEP